MCNARALIHGLFRRGGMRVPLRHGGAFVANYTHSYRAPALEELYNNGPHGGNATFEIGDPKLKRESNDGLISPCVTETTACGLNATSTITRSGISSSWLRPARLRTACSRPIIPKERAGWSNWGALDEPV